MPLLIALVFVALAALASARVVPAQAARYEIAAADAAATSFLAYRQGVIDYLNANPTFTGTVPDAVITFPWGYVRDPRWTNLVPSGGTLYVFEASAHSSHTDQVIDQLQRKALRSATVGRNTAGRLVGATGLVGLTVPAAVPEGALLMIGK